MKLLSHKKMIIILVPLVLSTIACGVSVGGEKVLSTEKPTIQTNSPGLNTIEKLAPVGLELQQPTNEGNPLITTNEEQLLVELYKTTNPSVVTIQTST